MCISGFELLIYRNSNRGYFTTITLFEGRHSFWGTNQERPVLSLANQNTEDPSTGAVLIGCLFLRVFSADWSIPLLASPDWFLKKSVLLKKRDKPSNRVFVYKQLKLWNTHSLSHQHSNCLLHFYKFHSCFLWSGSLFTSQILQRVNLSSDCWKSITYYPHVWPVGNSEFRESYYFI